MFTKRNYNSARAPIINWTIKMNKSERVYSDPVKVFPKSGTNINKARCKQVLGV